ncbi:hypothetical protein [Pseudonocardia parietis]|uniref:Uncharacterized protein YutE (UPF0331/DUF86 family) n=1 Tax=Pseudonocardia parietis TaxID=570936 RepID=A0ABS4VV01_9PSEU|nr:hypothetical protein [Pseudonocardia parietis]MBP2367731.1 uncharacterized protein YutE (UPF0331/DUF86 family) [Pseudonocardia parietis]
MAGTVEIDRAAVEHRLMTIRKGIDQLESLGPLGGARFENDPTTGLVVERILALLVDLAHLINRHAAEVVLGVTPRTCEASFGAAAKAGMIEESLAADLAPMDGPHHVLMQLSLDTEPEEAAAVVAGALTGYAEYVRQVAEWIADHRPGV